MSLKYWHASTINDHTWRTSAQRRSSRASRLGMLITAQRRRLYAMENMISLLVPEACSTAVIGMMMTTNAVWYSAWIKRRMQLRNSNETPSEPESQSRHRSLLMTHWMLLSSLEMSLGALVGQKVMLELGNQMRLAGAYRMVNSRSAIIRMRGTPPTLDRDLQER